MMAQPKVYVTRMIAQEALDLIQQHTDMRVWPEEVPPSYEVLKGEAVLLDGLLTTVEDRVDGELMDAAPGLKVISQMVVGCDNIAVAVASGEVDTGVVGAVAGCGVGGCGGRGVRGGLAVCCPEGTPVILAWVV